jgi:hypothetical protein
VKNSDTFSGQKFYWLGMIFIFLAVFAFGANWLMRKNPPRDLTAPIAIPGHNSKTNDSEAQKKNLLETLQFREVHESYQHSYLDLVQKLSEGKITG